MDKNNFEMSYSVDKTFDSDKFIKVRCRVCHDGESPNKTYFTKETMVEANKTSLEYIPILAHVYMDKDGKPIIGAHDMHIEEDRLNEGETRVFYDESPIGLVPSSADNNCTIEEYNGLNYTFVDAYIWRDYSNYAEQLVENAERTKLSMEIDFPEDALSYDAANERYNIASYRYRGITFLNESLGTGMKDAMATTTNFSANGEMKSKMIVLMEELQKCLREYDINTDEKGGNVNMEDEEIVETTEEVVEEPVVETMEEETVSEDEVAEETPAVEEEFIQEEETPTEEFVEDTSEDLVCTFRISHDDTRFGLQSLLNAMSDDSHFFAVISVYDKYFYYCDYFSGDAFKQGYKVRKDVVSFDGDPEPVFAEFVTQTEKDELEKLRKDYVALVEFKAKYDAAELKAKKDAIFAREEYSVLAENEEFKALVADAEKYSVEELDVKADVIFAKFVKSTGEYSVKPETNKFKTIGFNFNAKGDKKSRKPYGNLFQDKE